MTAVIPDRALPGACPLDCPDGCAWVVGVKDGKAVSLSGNRDHPYTRGALCVKMSRYLEHTQAPDRLLHPLRRIGAKGAGEFERITWDDAVGEIAERLERTIARHGGEAIWPYQGTGTLGYIQGLEGKAGARFWNVLGASSHVASICSISGSMGLRYATGASAGIDPEHFADAKLILLWGTNTLSTHHHLWKFVLAARSSGAYVVAIDPIRSRTARQADVHIAPLPGTDGALALGLINVVLSMGAEDAAFLEERTLGWDEFRDRVEEFTPEVVARVTGLEPGTIVALGERIARSRPTAIRATMGLQRHAGGGMTLRAISAIGAVTGDWRHPGGGVSYSTSGYFRGNVGRLRRDDLLQGSRRELLMTRLGDTLLERSDPPVDVLFVYGANPMASNPRTDKVRQGLSRDDLFTVVVEQFPTDTVSYADIVLPATMQTEHLDVHDGYGHMYVAWNEPAVEPPGECLPHTEIFRRLARAMNLDEPSLYDSDEELARQLLDSDDPSIAGITMDQLRRDGWARLGYPRPFIPFENGFPTPSGRFEFRSETAGRDGLDPLIGFTAPLEVADDARAQRFPLALISPASHHFLNSTFGNKPDLVRRAGGPTVTLHPLDAAERELEEGTRVKVHNDRGAFEATLAISEDVRPGVAAAPKGHWPKNVRGGDNVNATVDERDSDMGGGAVYHDNRVEVRAA